MGGQLALPVDCRTNGDRYSPAGVPSSSLSGGPATSVDVELEELAVAEVEVVDAGPVPAGVRRVTTVAVLAVALVAAAASYEHMRLLAATAGEGWRAWLLPVSVDGLVVAASMSLLVRKRAGQPAGLAWSALVLGLVASLAANVAAAEPTPVGRLVAAWPPVALLLAYELLMQQVRQTSKQTVRGGGSVGRQAHLHADRTPVGGGGDGVEPT